MADEGRKVKALVLGMGLQGRAVIHDLEQSPIIREIWAADMNFDQAQSYVEAKGYAKTKIIELNACQKTELSKVIHDSRANIIICMLPPNFGYPVAKVALDLKIPFVSSSYAGKVIELDAEAQMNRVAILPEMGMDPGIDLILGRLAVDKLEEVHGLYSYGAGLPEPACANDNPINYKITWTFNGVLETYKRAARFLKNGKEQCVSGEEIFNKEHGHMVEVSGIGALEAYPNGDAIHYIDIFKLGESIRDMGRFALRWPGHSQFWRTMVQLGFLEDAPLDVGGVEISPRQFLVHHLTPKLQFSEDERDIVILRVKAWGVKQGKNCDITYDLIDFRDVASGLFAMNRTVGFATSIAAQMILSGKIQQTGVLSPALHVPPDDFLDQLKRRGMRVSYRVENTK